MSIKRSETGFTILELMIATTLLSVILVLITVAIIGVGKTYQKGVNQAKLQNNIRSVTDELQQHLQLSDVDPTPGSTPAPPPATSSWCIGSQRYSYILNTQRGTDPGQFQHVLWRDTNPGGACPALSSTALNSTVPSPDGTELVGANTTLYDFTITKMSASVYTISIGLVYGDPDLVDASSHTCKGGSGQEFCATAALRTTITRRL